MQPTPPGWYFDPRGRPSLWRWFTGRDWTEWLSADPRAPAPTRQPALTPTVDGRFVAGGLTFPVLPAPWRRAPGYLHLVDAIGQEFVVGQSGRGPYIACVFIGHLPVDRPDTLPEDLAAATDEVTRDLLATFYPHENPHAPVVFASREIDDRPAWQATVTLDIDDDHLEFESEEVSVIVVNLADNKVGVFYASLPAVEQLPSMTNVVDQLHVSAST